MDIELLETDVVLPNNSYVFINLPSLFGDFKNHTGVVRATHVSADDNEWFGGKRVSYLVKFPDEGFTTWVSSWDVVGYLMAA